MFSVIWWIIWTIFDSISSWFYKKSISQSRLKVWMFKFFIFIFWLINISILIYFFWYEINILFKYKDLFYIFLISFIWVMWWLIHINLLKKVKLSEILPYENLDKLFIIIFWFFIFYWTNNWSSWITLIITIITLFVIILFTIDFNKIKIPKNIWIFTFYKLLRSFIWLLTWYLLISYLSSTFIVTDWLFALLIYLSIILITNDKFITIFQQSKWFYISRLSSVLFWNTAWIISIFLIKELWIIVWTLFWFLGIVSSIFTMKLILNDSPTNKQILLAFIVILLIWTWYYFK
jgi:hypothetical protein